MASSKNIAPMTPPARQLASGFRARVAKSSVSTIARKTYPRSFLSVLDFDSTTFVEALSLANRVKRERRLGRRAPTAQALAGLHVALLFDKPSLRTRATFEIAVRELGGDAIELPQDAPLGTRESVEDVARNLERWVACAVVRTFQQSRLEALAKAAPRLHVINALTDQEHPCQALADVLTLHEIWGRLEGRTIAFVGDGNNVATSLVQAAMLAGVHVRIASPEGFALPEEVVREAAVRSHAGATVARFRDPIEAVTGADAVYTDVWTSMGQEGESDARREAFRAYQVNEALMAHAESDAVFMHCLPAHRGEEVTADVVDAPYSVVFDQAENRLHVQKALLLMLVSGTR
jgi:ornithine carbamoyltransferase